jgi:hypothetical protein
MPNFAAPRGFTPSRYRNGSPYMGACTLYCIPQAEANQIGPGDAVKTLAGSDANGIPNITKITNGTDAARGVVIGVLVAAPNLPSLVGVNLDLTVQYAPATKTRDYYALVVDDQDVLFEVQDNGLSALGTAAANKNASFTVTNPTSPQQNSGSVILNASVAVTSTLPLKLIGAVQKPNNDPAQASCAWLVMWNLHEFNGPTAGV